MATNWALIEQRETSQRRVVGNQRQVRKFHYLVRTRQLKAGEAWTSSLDTITTRIDWYEFDQFRSISFTNRKYICVEDGEVHDFESKPCVKNQTQRWEHYTNWENDVDLGS